MKKYEFSITGNSSSMTEEQIERGLPKIDNKITNVEYSVEENKVRFDYLDYDFNLNNLNSALKNNGYSLSEINRDFVIQFGQNGHAVVNKLQFNKYFNVILISLAIILAYLILDKFINGNVNFATELAAGVTSIDSYGTIFLAGIVAGITSSVPIIGSLILTLSRGYNLVEGNSIKDKSVPHLMFHAGRIIGFTILGMLLGLIGTVIYPTVEFNAFVIIAVSLFTIVTGGRMFGFGFLNESAIRMPRLFSLLFGNRSEYKFKYKPFVTGVLTFFVPGGLTVLAQLASLNSNNMVAGGAIMFVFSLGTTITLGLISAISVWAINKDDIKDQFIKVAGLVSVFLGFIALNIQFAILKLPNTLSISTVFDFVELILFVVLFGMYASSLIKQIRGLRYSNGFSLLGRLLTLTIFILFGIGFALAYNVVWPWEWSFRSIGF